MNTPRNAAGFRLAVAPVVAAALIFPAPADAQIKDSLNLIKRWAVKTALQPDVSTAVDLDGLSRRAEKGVNLVMNGGTSEEVERNANETMRDHGRNIARSIPGLNAALNAWESGKTRVESAKEKIGRAYSGARGLVAGAGAALAGRVVPDAGASLASGEKKWGGTDSGTVAQPATDPWAPPPRQRQEAADPWAAAPALPANYSPDFGRASPVSRVAPAPALPDTNDPYAVGGDVTARVLQGLAAHGYGRASYAARGDVHDAAAPRAGGYEAELDALETEAAVRREEAERAEAERAEAERVAAARREAERAAAAELAARQAELRYEAEQQRQRLEAQREAELIMNAVQQVSDHFLDTMRIVEQHSQGGQQGGETQRSRDCVRDREPLVWADGTVTWPFCGTFSE